MRLLPLLVLLVGCASSPYADIRLSYQHDSGSDWVLQPEREWVEDRTMSMSVQVGTEWDNGAQCYADITTPGSPWQQAFVGCSMRFGDKWFIEPALVHQIDSLSSSFIRTDQRQWQGQNPFVHLRAGYYINPAFRVNLASGMSTRAIEAGKIWDRHTHEPDLYWTNIEFSGRIGGKHGLFSMEHLN